jgi:DNA replication protein DnaC
VLDEVGYMSYGLRHADLLFEVISRRYERQRPVIVTTNRPFTEWGETFPNATCVVTLVDRLVHRCEVVHVDGTSFRLKESLDRRHARSQERSR